MLHKTNKKANTTKTKNKKQQIKLQILPPTFSILKSNIPHKVEGLNILHNQPWYTHPCLILLNILETEFNKKASNDLNQILFEHLQQ